MTEGGLKGALLPNVLCNKDSLIMKLGTMKSHTWTLLGTHRICPQAIKTSDLAAIDTHSKSSGCDDILKEPPGMFCLGRTKTFGWILSLLQLP